MDDINGTNRSRFLLALIVGILTAVLIIKAQTPDMFLRWFLSIVIALSLLFLALFVCVMMFIVIAAVVRRYTRRRFLDDGLVADAEQDTPATPLQHSNDSSKPGTQRTRQPRLHYRPPGDFTDNGC